MNSQRTRDINELKKQAIQFYTENSDITKRVEDALNNLFYDSPYDVYGYLSEFFVKFSKPPFFTKLEAKKSQLYDSKCQPTFKLDFYVQSKNVEQKVLSIEAPCFSHEPINESAKLQNIQEDDEFRSHKVNEVINFINSDMSELIRNFSPFDQDELDERLRNLFKSKHNQIYQAFMTSLNLKAQSGVSDMTEGKKSKTPTSPKQKVKNRKASQAPGANSFGDDLSILLQSNFFASFMEPLLSKSICLCSSIVSNKQPFQIISEIQLKTNLDKFSMPIPMITVIQNGKGYPGKQNLVKEFIILPKPHLSVQEAIDLISRVNRTIRDNLYQSKNNPGPANKCVTDIGAYTCPLETPQQGLELIENAIISTLGTEVGFSLSIALNISATEIYDQEKSKYESGVGTFKSSDELVDIFADLISKFPRIMMLIEPFINSDQLAWYRLYTRVSKFCLVANNIKQSDIPIVENNPTEPTEEITSPVDTPKFPDVVKNPNSIRMPVNFYKFENATNVSHIGRLLKENSDKKLINGLSCGLNETNDDFIADLSVGNQVKFLKIGGFNRSERVKKINRLIEIEYFLAENRKLLDSKNEQRDIKFSPEIEIPADISEILSNYEDPKNAKPTKK